MNQDAIQENAEKVRDVILRQQSRAICGLFVYIDISNTSEAPVRQSFASPRFFKGVNMKNSKPLRRPLFHVTLAMMAAHAIATGNAWASDGNASQPFMWKDGPHAYASICAYCHESGVGPQIRNRSLPPEYIRGVVRHGLGAMPPFRIAEIDDESLAQLADFISKSKARP